ncbi:MAG: DUF4435 domain-containing protein [Lachnospiraceae bacterium]|nr:DUF4435 domain-containing protein [Lachnospiraceae bacterium]
MVKGTTIEKMSLSPVELADELSMINKDYLVVEGQSDKNFWEHLQQEGLKKRQIRVANKKQCSGNKEYIKRVITIMNQRNRKNVIGIIDLDYDFVQNNIECIDNLYYYRYIDLENILVQSSAFSEVNALISSSKKKLRDDDLKDILYEKSYILGILRLVNDIEKYNFSFEDVDYKKLLDYDKEKFLQYFLSKMDLKKVQRSEVCSEIEELIKREYDYKYICNGHDLLGILSQLTKKKISNDNPIQYTEEIIEKMLVLGYRKMETALDVGECLNELLI